MLLSTSIRSHFLFVTFLSNKDNNEISQVWGNCDIKFNITSKFSHTNN